MLKKRKFCLLGIAIVIVIPFLVNYTYFHKSNTAFNFYNFIHANLNSLPLIITNLISFALAFILCSIKDIIKDVDVFKQIENEIKPFETLLENAPAIVVQLSLKGFPIYVNEEFEKISGYKRDDVINKVHISKFYEGGIKTAKKIMKILRSTKKGGIGKIKNYKLNIITRYGEIIPTVIFGAIVYVNSKEHSTVGYLFDIRDRLALEEKLLKSKEQYRILIENAGEGMYIRQEHQFKYMNKKFKEMLGYSDEDELKNISIEKIIDKDRLPYCSQIYEKILQGECVENPYESVFIKKNGEKIYVEITINTIEYNGKPAVQGFVRDITDKKILSLKLKDMNKKLRELSIKDELTQIYNYRYFREKLKEKYLESKRYNIPISLMILDIDDFKKVNDTYGHLAGDYVLKEVALILQSKIRQTDILARYGGEEFVILLPFTSVEKAEKIAKRILESIRNREFIYELNIIKITVSIGISSFENVKVKNEDELLRIADEALYKVKKSGKDNILSFNQNGNVA